MKGNVKRPESKEENAYRFIITKKERNLVFFLGVGSLLFVPVFKTITHLPPYLGMLGGLGILWIVVGFMHKRRPESDYNRLSVNNILGRIDTPSILFFLGILMAVNALQTCGQLGMLSASLDQIPMVEPGKYYFITVIIGFLSSIVDNVPLVAGAMGMYTFPMNHYFWEFLAYAAGTGGSILIIGSAAGVAVMGMEKIDFIWYLKKISWLALIGYLAGAGAYILQQNLF
jgi:Na+/H+ antiporter NhaD/arsenite permease-like protein